MVKEVKDENFDETVLRPAPPVLVLAYAEWCGDSRRILPVFEELSSASKYGGISFVQVEVDANPAAKAALGVKRYPTLYLFKAGKEIEERVAEVSREEQGQIIRALAESATH